jgi:hypothetical protein
MKAREWTIYDGSTAAPTLMGPPIAYAENVKVREVLPDTPNRVTFTREELNQFHIRAQDVGFNEAFDERFFDGVSAVGAGGASGMGRIIGYDKDGIAIIEVIYESD